MLKAMIFCLVAGLLSVNAQTFSLSGRVLRSGGGYVSGATVKLMGASQLTTTSDANGYFTLSTTAIMPWNGIVSGYSFNVLKNGILLSLSRKVAHGRAEFLAWNGKVEASLSLNDMESGSHTLGLPRLGPGVYFLRVELDGSSYTHRLLNIDGNLLDMSRREEVASTPNARRALAKSAAIVDTLLAAKTGYEDAKVSVNSQGTLQVVMYPLCTIPTMPAVASLPTNAKMPDPFKMMGGSRIASKDDWGCRRAEISKQFQNYELGFKPPRPRSVTGTLRGDTLNISVTDSGKTLSFNVVIKKPTTGAGPFPVLIAYGSSSISDVLPLGVATLNFNNDEMAKNTGGSTTADRGKGLFYNMFGAGHSAGAMMAWAWAVSRIIDALETTPGTNLDPMRIAVTGCSRNGKGALIAGAFDERISLVIPQESGSGGSGNWRVSDYMLNTLKQSTQDLKEIVGEEPWFGPAFNAFSGKVGQLPFDHHMLMGLVAPRGLLVIENDILWLGPMSSFSSAVAGKRIFDALGVPDAITYSEVGKHNHCSFPTTSQKHWVDSYVTKFLLGGTGEASKIENDQSLTFDEARWVDWTTPTLQ